MMNIKRLGNRFLGGLAGLALFALASPAHALPSFSFAAPNNPIAVGDDFKVEFGGTFDSELELVSFAFDVDRLGSLLVDGVIKLTSWSVAAPLTAFSFGDPEVGALNNDPSTPLFGGVNVPLATLNFTALSAGMSTVQFSGLSGPPSYQGVTLYDFANNSFQSYDLEGSFEVVVNDGGHAVPDSPITGALPAMLIGLALLRRLRPKTK